MSEMRISVEQADCLAGCPTGRGELKRAWRLMFAFFDLEWGLPSSGPTSIIFRVREPSTTELDRQLLNWG